MVIMSIDVIMFSGCVKEMCREDVLGDQVDWWASSLLFVARVGEFRMSLLVC
jgi:hypothetical protein